MKKTLPIIALFVFIFSNIHSQILTNLYNFNTVSQSSIINPSQFSKYKLVIGLPALNNLNIDYSNPLFNYNDIYKTSNLNINIANVIKNLETKKILNINVNNDLIYAGFKLKKGFLSFGNSLQANISFTISKKFIQFFNSGNVEYSDVVFNKHDLNLFAQSILIHHIGYQYPINDNLSIGGRLKYINGLSNVFLNQFNSSIKSDFFNITANNDISIYSSGINNLKKTSLNKNKGYAIDIGATYKKDLFEFSVSLLNLGGKITWKNDLKTYKSKGSYNWNGDDLTSNDLTINYDSILNNFKNHFDIKENSEYNFSSYTTKMPLQLILSTKYNLTEKHSFGIIYNRNILYEFKWSNLSVQYIGNLNKIFSIMAGYSIISKTYFNIPLGVSIKTGVFQFYIMSDNAYGAIFLNNMKSTSLKLGINFNVFNKTKSYDTEKESIENLTQ